MKSSSLFAVGLMALTAPVWAQNQVLIDTKFDLPLVDGKLATAPKPGAAGDLPARAPTRFGAQAPSAITPGTETLGDLAPPYAVFRDEGRESNPEASGNPAMEWNLADLALESGQYELTYQITPLTQTIRGGRVQVILYGEDGKPVPVHVGEQPLYANFSGDRIVANGGRDRASRAISEGVKMTVQIRFDLDQKVWSVTVDDSPLFEDLPFNSRFLEAAPAQRIGRVVVQSQAGLGDQPPASWALSELRLVRLK